MWDQYGNWLPVEGAQADWTGDGYSGMPGYYGGDPDGRPFMYPGRRYPQVPPYGYPWFIHFFPGMRRRRRRRRYDHRDHRGYSGY